VLDFALKAFFPGAASRPGGSAFAARCGGAPYERLKPVERLGPVFLLAAVLLGLDDDHPSRVMRWSFSFNRRSLMRPGSDEARMSKRRWTAVATLLTFWPPAPWARTALISISLKGWRLSLKSASFFLIHGLQGKPSPSGHAHRTLT